VCGEKVAKPDEGGGLAAHFNGAFAGSI